MTLIYRKNDKHKKGACGSGPPRWFPSTSSLCPEDLSHEEAQELLEDSLEGKSADHPNNGARFAYRAGHFYKGYCEQNACEGQHEIWHGYPVSRELVPSQVPARILRSFRDNGLISKAEYKKLIGNAQ